MSDINASDAGAILCALEERLGVFHSETKQKLDDLIYKEQVNQLWKVGVESTMHNIWAKICSQRVGVSVSCQTDEGARGISRKSSSHRYENGPNIPRKKRRFALRVEDLESSCQDESSSDTIIVDYSLTNENNSFSSAGPDTSHKQCSKHDNKPRSTKDKPYPCTHCNNQHVIKSSKECFIALKHLTHEQSQYESTKQSVKCEVCSRILISQTALTRHYRLCRRPAENRDHCAIEEKRFPCRYCKEKFITSRLLNKHMRWQHVA